MNEVPNESATNANFEFAALEVAANYRAALVREFAPFLRGDVVEVGAGVGHISEQLHALETVARLTAIEPGPHLVRKFRERLPNVSIVEGTIDDFGEHDLDTIVSINVLEHILHDEQELTRYARQLSARAGHLCLFVPARPELYAPIDRDVGHHRRYEKRALHALLQRAGFEVLRLEYFNSVGYLAWWVNFCLLKKRDFDPRKVKVFDRAIFPVVRALESRLGAPPIGQSLIAVARALPLASAQ